MSFTNTQLKNANTQKLTARFLFSNTAQRNR